MGLMHTRQIDRLLHAWFGGWTLGLSPASLWLAYFDWALHFAFSPGKQLELMEKALRESYRLSRYAWEGAIPDGCPEGIGPLPQDQR